MFKRWYNFVGIGKKIERRRIKGPRQRRNSQLAVTQPVRLRRRVVEPPQHDRNGNSILLNASILLTKRQPRIICQPRAGGSEWHHSKPFLNYIHSAPLGTPTVLSGGLAGTWLRAPKPQGEVGSQIPSPTDTTYWRLSLHHSIDI